MLTQHAHHAGVQVEKHAVVRSLGDGLVEIRIGLTFGVPLAGFVGPDQALDDGANLCQIVFVGTQRGVMRRRCLQFAAKFEGIPA